MLVNFDDVWMEGSFWTLPSSILRKIDPQLNLYESLGYFDRS
jgi:hypothetical protein